MCILLFPQSCKKNETTSSTTPRFQSWKEAACRATEFYWVFAVEWRKPTRKWNSWRYGWRKFYMFVIIFVMIIWRIWFFPYRTNESSLQIFFFYRKNQCLIFLKAVTWVNLCLVYSSNMQLRKFLVDFWLLGLFSAKWNFPVVPS